MTTPDGYDVFLSHNSKDKPRTRQLKGWLDANGLNVWFDEEELRPGIPDQPLLEKGILASKSVAVLFGPSGIGPWEDEEMQAALRLAVRKQTPVIPVLLPGAGKEPELPLFLINRTWVDLREGFTPAGIAKLLWGITGEKWSEGEVRTPPLATGNRRPDTAQSRVPKELPPRATAEKFFGRKKLLKSLTARLAAGHNAAVVGPGGMGKTALAAEALGDLVGKKCEKLAGSPFSDGIVYLDLYRHKGNANAVWNSLAHAFIGDTDSHLPAEQRARQACDGRRALIVFEGAEEADGKEGRAQLRDIVAVLDCEANRQLVLTREKTQAFTVGTIYLEAPLEADEAAALFDKLAGKVVTGQVRADILELLAGHPLALTWAGSLLGRRTDSPTDLLADWRRGNLPSLADPDYENRTLRWLFERSTRGLGEAERTALTAAGLLAHAPFPRSAIEAALGENSVHARKALVHLVERSFLRLLPAPEGGEDAWQFTHVLSYQFARAETGVDPALLRVLADWNLASLKNALGSPRDGINRLLQHTAALLRADATQAAAHLADFALFGARARLTALGNLTLVESALRAFEAWTLRWPAGLTKEQEPRLERKRSVFFLRKGDLATAQGKLSEAEHYFAQALAITQRLAEFDPANADWQRDLAISCERLGDLFTAQGKLPDAEVQFMRSTDIWEKLGSLDSANADFRRGTTIPLERLGDLAIAQGKLPEAECYFAQALAIRKSLAESDPANADWQRALSISLNKLGDLAQAQGKLTEAEVLFAQDLAIAQRLAESDPVNAGWQRDLAVSFTNLGELAKALGKFPEAERLFTQALAIAQRLAESDPANADWQRTLSVSLNLLGDLAISQGKLTEARCLFSQDLAIAQRLAESDPANAGWQRDLSISFDKIGDVLRAQGDLPAALKAFKDSLTIRKRLTESDPANAGWQGDLFVIDMKLALLAEQNDQPTEALRFAEQGLPIIERLARLAPGHAQWQQNLANAQRDVARLRGKRNGPQGGPTVGSTP